MPPAKTAFAMEPSPTVEDAAPLIERVPLDYLTLLAGSDRTTSLRSVPAITPGPCLARISSHAIR
jgi:hypothetical protein